MTAPSIGQAIERLEMFDTQLRRLPGALVAALLAGYDTDGGATFADASAGFEADLRALLSWAQDAARGLDAAERQFREYAHQHRAKEPPQIGKAETNDRMADALAALLARWNANAAAEAARAAGPEHTDDR